MKVILENSPCRIPDEGYSREFTCSIPDEGYSREFTMQHT
jgi:hypothetical protein